MVFAQGHAINARMIRRVIRWGFYLLILALVLIVALVLCIDTLVRSVAESRIRSQTGLDVKIGKFAVGLSSPMITIEDFKLFNTAEFGGGEFVQMPELHLEYDRTALRAGHLHLKLVRLNLSEINVIENKDGVTNVDDLKKRQGTTSSGGSTNQTQSRFIFDGIDTLNLSIGKARFTSAKRPSQNRDVPFGIKNQIFTNVKTERDLETVAATIALKAGANFMLEGMFSNPVKLIDGGSTAGKQVKNILDSTVAPLKISPRKTNQVVK